MQLGIQAEEKGFAAGFSWLKFLLWAQHLQNRVMRLGAQLLGEL